MIKNKRVYKLILKSDIFKNELSPLFNEIKENTRFTLYNVMGKTRVFQSEGRLSFYSPLPKSLKYYNGVIKHDVTSSNIDEIDEIVLKMIRNWNGYFGKLSKERNAKTVKQSVYNMLYNALKDNIDSAVNSEVRVDNYDILVKSVAYGIFNRFGYAIGKNDINYNRIIETANRLVKMNTILG